MKNYNLIKKDINQLPLAELGRQYLALRDLSWKKHVLASREHAKIRNQEMPEASALADSFRSLGSVEKLELEVLLNRFSDTFQLTKNANWFFPQALAKLAQVKLPRVDNKVSAKALVKEYYSKDNFLMGIYTIFMYAKRGSILKNQTSESSRNFSKLVPLIMSAYKQYTKVQYEEWIKDEVYLVVDPDLYLAIEQGFDSETGWYIEALTRGYIATSVEELKNVDYKGFDIATILGWRNDALTIKSGEKRGNIRSPVSTYSMSPSEDNPLKELDPLTRHMYLQTWCAHPDNRTEYMILDIYDWDNIPEPFVDIKFLHPSIEEEFKMLHNAAEDIVDSPPW